VSYHPIFYGEPDNQPKVDNKHSNYQKRMGWRNLWLTAEDVMNDLIPNPSNDLNNCAKSCEFEPRNIREFDCAQ
jgi:hypothetical protein